MNYSHLLVTEEERNGYLAWRDSFGGTPPVESGALSNLSRFEFMLSLIRISISFSDPDNHAASPVVNYLKERLALDALLLPVTQLALDAERMQLVLLPEDKLAAYENCDQLVKLHLNLLFNCGRRNVDVNGYQITMSEEAKSRKFCRVVGGCK